MRSLLLVASCCFLVFSCGAVKIKVKTTVKPIPGGGKITEAGDTGEVTEAVPGDIGDGVTEAVPEGGTPPDAGAPPCDCCGKIDSLTALMNSMLSRQDREMRSLMEMKTKVVNDFPYQLKGMAKDLQTMRAAIMGTLQPEMKKQSTMMEDMGGVLGDLMDKMDNQTMPIGPMDGLSNGTCQPMQALEPMLQDMYDALVGPKDCSDIKALGNHESGVYRVYPGSLAKRMQADVYCDMTTPGGEWLVLQRRMDGSVNFERKWDEYCEGFGNVTGEFWLGNELMYLLTSNQHYKLRIEMEDIEGKKRIAEYCNVTISSPADKYRLSVRGYTGNAGDSLSEHSGMQFTTIDEDNDINAEGNCAQICHGGWWYTNCHASNLNGRYLRGPHKSYADGIEWKTFRGYQNSLKTTEMKIAVAN